MSQAHVGIVIETLLADENLRIRFALERLETIADLCVRGIELTSGEIDLFCQTDAHLWFLGDGVRHEWRQWAGTREADGPESPTPDTAQSGEASLAQLMDEIITQIAQRQTRRLYE
jgi:hypothetical protein